MSIPEPLDERPAGGLEIRGGDRDEDFIPAFLQPGEYILPAAPAAGGDCGCGDCGCGGG